MKGAARAGILAALLVATLAGPARGFVRDKTDAGIPVYWSSSCVPVTIYVDKFTMMSRDEVAKSIAAAAHTWSPEAVTCPDPSGSSSHPYLEIVPGMADPAAPAPPAKDDRRNVILFLNSGWEEEHDRFAVAVTTLMKKMDGRILDADVEINAEFATWANIDPGWAGPSPDEETPFDLQNAITHEFGHLIGLDHTCFVPGANKERPIDNNGNPVNDCGPSAPLEVMQTVMYATIRGENQETSKRFLSPDDIAGVCEIYRAGRDPHVCALDLPDDGCACASARASARGGKAGAGVAGLALLALLVSCRRRSKATPPPGPRTTSPLELDP